MEPAAFVSVTIWLEAGRVTVRRMNPRLLMKRRDPPDHSIRGALSRHVDSLKDDRRVCLGRVEHTAPMRTASAPRPRGYPPRRPIRHSDEMRVVAR